MQTDKKTEKVRPDTDLTPRQPLTVDALEARIAPALLADKKAPEPPYPAGTRYGLIRRDSLQY
ncbi:MAG: hypothetical protein JW797_19935 [Bradymonadales bacterium]|nr:hypothetical protein [Bradymonadales bacterium]